MSDVAVSEKAGESEDKEGAYDPSGMTVEEFFQKSVGQWKSQRSSHNLAWAQFEAVTSDICIVEKPVDDLGVAELCASNNVEPADVLVSIEMSWKGESDWDSEEVVAGCTLMSVVKDTGTSGRLLRSSGYAETIPAVGNWKMTPEGSFILHTMYDMAAAEERIWFATPDLRLRVSNIRTSSGRGVVTASFSSEIRTANG
jgi:phycoerythrin-associated linker protein